MYGLLDTVDGLWMGTESGPNLYPDNAEGRALATVAALVVCDQLGWPKTRIRAVPYDGGPEPRRRDSIETKRTPLEALIRLEEGVS